VKFGLVCLSCLMLFSCRSTNLADWPDDLPTQSYFISSYSSDHANQAVQSQQEYLEWILSFYAGTLVAPTGWTDLQSLVIAAAPVERRPALQVQLRDLGGQIAAEWAKANDLRIIDSRMLGIWGSVLQMAVAPDQQFQAIQLISNDVAAILSGNLPASDIADSRYEQQLGLQLFGDF
jgi:hypothetical protein